MHLDFELAYNLKLTPDEFRLVVAALGGSPMTPEEKEGAAALHKKMLEQRASRAAAWAKTTAERTS